MYNLCVHSKYRWLKSVKYKNLVSLSPNFAFDINPFYTYRYRCPGDFVEVNLIFQMTILSRILVLVVLMEKLVPDRFAAEFRFREKYV